MLLFKIYSGIAMFLNIISTAIVVYALMTWFVRPGSGLYQWMHRIMDPILAPFRPLAQRLMSFGLMFDMTPWIALIALRIVQAIITMVFGWFW